MNNPLEEIRAKRQAWLEAYNAATPEEKERMLQEKKRKQEIEEEQRKQRIYEDRKAEFLGRYERQIACYKSLQQAMKVALEVMESFDGKVLNNRLTNAINEKITMHHVAATLTISYNYSSQNNEGKLTIEDYNYHGLDNQVSFTIILSPLADGNRVMWKATEENFSKPGMLVNIADKIKEWKQAAKGYDKIYQKAMKVYSIIEEYAKENYHVRSFLREKSVIGNTYYL